MKMFTKNLTAVAVSTLLVSAPVMAEDWSGEAKDAWIDGKVEASLMMNESLNDFELDSTVKDGNVTLVGLVGTEEQRSEAESIAQNIDGVTDVDNMIKIDASLQSEIQEQEAKLDSERDWTDKAKDAWIDSKVEMSLMMNDSLDDFDLNSTVRDGEVTLTGLVGTETQRVEAENIALGVEGVTDVENMIKIDTSVVSSDLEAAIEQKEDDSSLM